MAAVGVMINLSLHVPTAQIKVVFDKHHDKLSRVAVISGEASRRRSCSSACVHACMSPPWVAPPPPPLRQSKLKTRQPENENPKILLLGGSSGHEPAR